MRCRRSPESRIGGAEEEQARNAAGGGEMADTGVVAEEETAVGEAGDELAERELVRALAEGRERGRGGRVGFTGDKE